MKKYRLMTGLFVLVGLVTWNFFSSNHQPEQKKRGPASTTPGYCIALRGNGEAEPAHWGALARSVEQLGLPSAMAGGSSATVSMFLMEAIAAHPMIQGQDLETQKERASLLLKSMVGFFGEVQNSSSWIEFKKLYALATSVKDEGTLKEVLAKVNAKQFQQALKLLEQGVQLGLLDPGTLHPLFVSLKKQDLKRSQFYIKELQASAASFGSFNAETDDNLFFRPGIVSFEKAAETFGRIAGFYALASQDTAQTQNWKAFFDSCQKDSIGFSWLEIAQKNPNCASLFSKLFATEFSNGSSDIKYEEQRIGTQFPVYASTAILTGTSVTEFREAQLDYDRKMDHSFGENFQVSEPDDIRFGYWGNPEDLQRIDDNLDMNDEKSRRFIPLGSTVWRQVLSLSPAEPGLSPLKEFSTENGKEFISAGGWSDLHPVQVLKAAGCENVLYITRQGGESVFAQGVAKRLMNFERPWSSITDKEDSSDQSSLWSYLYNLGNPHSSFATALQNAGAVMCTNWNDFPVKSHFMELVDDSYRASYWKNPTLNATAFSKLTPALTDKKLGCSL